MPPKGKEPQNQAMLNKNKQAELNMTIQKNDTLQENINANIMKETNESGENLLGKNQITAAQLLNESAYKKMLEAKHNKKSIEYQESKALVQNTSKESFENMTPLELMKWATASSVVDGATQLFQNVVIQLEKFNTQSDKVQKALDAKDLASAEKELAQLQQDAKDMITNASTYEQNRKGFLGIKFSEKGKSRLAFCNVLRYMAIETLTTKQVFLKNEKEPNSYLLDDNANFQAVCIEKMTTNEENLGIELNEKNAEKISAKRGKIYLNMLKKNAEFRYNRDAAFLEKADKDETLQKDPNYEFANNFRKYGQFNVNAYFDSEVASTKCLFAKHLEKGATKNNQEVIDKLKAAFDVKIEELAALKIEKKRIGFENDALNIEKYENKLGAIKNKIGHMEESLQDKDSTITWELEALIAASECIDKGKLFTDDLKEYLEKFGLGDDSLYEKE